MISSGTQPEGVYGFLKKSVDLEYIRDKKKGVQIKTLGSPGYYQKRAAQRKDGEGHLVWGLTSLTINANHMPWSNQPADNAE